ncbi:hypothetical protein LCGC14_2301970, partial [marine sediment metagenome]
LLGLGSLVGTMIFPAAKAVTTSMKVGKLATRAGAKAAGGIKALETTELAKWKASGLIEKDVASYAEMGGDAGIRRMRQETMRKTRLKKYEEGIADKVARGEDPVPAWIKKDKPFERVKYEFDKQFANTYTSHIGKEKIAMETRRKFHEEQNRLWNSDTVDTVFKNMPDASSGPRIGAYLLGRNNPTLAGKAAKDFGPMSAVDKRWADYYHEAAKFEQTSMVEDGFLTEAAYRAMGETHLPALNIGTPNAGIGTSSTYLQRTSKRDLAKRAKTTAAGLIEREVPRRGLGRLFGKTKTVIESVGETSHSAMSKYSVARLTSATLLPRKKTSEQAYKALQSGKLITDPHDFTVVGLMNDKLLHSNYRTVRDILIDPHSQFTATADDIATFGLSHEKALEKGWIHMGKAGSDAESRLMRMIAKKTGKPETALPYVRKEIFEEIWGKNGMMEQVTSKEAGIAQVMATMYKTVNTAFNPATHLQNTAGNMIFLRQAGFNILSNENRAITKQMTQVFNKIAEVRKAGKRAGMDVSLHGRNSALNSIDYGTIKIGKKTFNLNDEMNDPIFRELIEESAFDAVEG